MQEISLTLSKYFQRGLRPESKAAHGAEWLTACKNMKPQADGLWGVALIASPFASGVPAVTDVWPFPQLFETQRERWLFEATAVYPVTGSSPSFTKGTVATTYNYRAQSTPLAITTGGVWHFATLGYEWIATNGICSVLQYNPYATTGVANKVFVDTSVVVQAVAAHRGRFLFGGFNSSDSWPATWDAIFSAWLAKTTITTYDNNNLRANFVLWTPPGQYALSLFSPPSDPESLIQDNQFGFMPMPWNGTVQAIKPLGERVVVYGTTGVTILGPINVPAPSYGIVGSAPVGVAHRGAVGGDDSEHVFMDTTGDLWRVSASEGFRRLGYKEHLLEMLSKAVIITLDTARREYYISGATSEGSIRAWVLTPQGLGQNRQQVTSMWNIGSQLYAIASYSSGAVAQQAHVITHETDFGVRDFKTVTTVEVGVDTAYTVQVRVYYRNSKADSWSASGLVLVNAEGFARVQVTAVEFRFVVLASDHAAIRLDYLTVHVQGVGKRTVRGVNVTQA